MNQSNKFQHFHAELPYKGIYKTLKIPHSCTQVIIEIIKPTSVTWLHVSDAVYQIFGQICWINLWIFVCIMQKKSDKLIRETGYAKTCLIKAWVFVISKKGLAGFNPSFRIWLCWLCWLCWLHVLYFSLSPKLDAKFGSLLRNIQDKERLC